MALSLICAAPLWAAEQNPQLEVGPARPGRDVGIAVAAAMFNVVYVPARLALTTVMAGLGGVTGWLCGGDYQTSRALLDATDGQAYITPDILEGRERLRFGHSRWQQ
ncbi:MAG TPA: hypothetical protein VMT89_03305 [Candidatus Acidoferrales bacterium]|nr:hypothetical protein [Candidatus Acidoferrales bacterium]